jgi:hypothetical protein
MGNSYSSNSSNSSNSSTDTSAEKEFNNFYDIIDYIATYYILTMDFKSLSKLSEKSYCDKLVVLTSDIIERYFNNMEITYLAQRIKDGVEVNNLNKEKLIFISKDHLETLDVANDEQKSIRKKRVCIGISKFYVKIAHVFAAIVMTINPVYTYKDATGKTVKTGLLEKDTIPKNVNRKLYKLNVCDNRIRALKRGETIDESTGNVTIQPKVCDMNKGINGLDKTLADEPGINELMKLYLDDNYDFSNGSFTGMSESTKKQFMKDLKLFYTTFTGNETMPPEIAKFSDIKLKDYNKKPGCQGETPVLKNKYTIDKKDKLFIEYAENTKKMIQNAADNQSKLLSVINDIFTYVIDPYSNKRVIRVNPKLTDESLQKAVEKSRRFIVDLYIKCESDYVNGIKLYEAIVEAKILETTQKQIETLKTEASKIIKETKTAVVTPIKEEQFVKPPPQVQPVVVAGVVQSEKVPLTTEIINESSVTNTIPTTVVPTNIVPTNIVPTNPMPTTVVPTNSVPTTVVPTNTVPTNIVPTNPMPTTVVPTNSVPTNSVPTTVVPTNSVPTTVVPTNSVPTTVVPTNSVPTTVVTTNSVPTTATI